MEKIMFYNGDIITMENRNDKADYVLIENGRIKKVGKLNEIEEENGSIRKIDLKGKTLMPAFIDAHSHITAYAKTFSYIDLKECKSIKEILEKIEKYIENNKLKKEDWIIGVGYDNNFLREKRHPKIDELNKLEIDNPILITHISGHMGVFNNKGLEKLGIKESKTKKGYLEENDFIKQTSKIGKLSKKEEKENIKKAEKKYLSYGITTVQDGLTKKDDFELLKEMSEEKGLEIDVISYIDLMENKNIVKQNKGFIKRYKNHLKIGGYKIILDGSPQAKTAWLTKPYEGEKEYRGYPSMKDEEVNDFIKIANEENMQLLAHCNGDCAIDQLVKGIKQEAIKKGVDNIRKQRTVMVHAQTIRKDQIIECKELGIIPSFFISHVYYWGDIHIENLGKRAYRISPAKEAEQNSIIYTFHQDTPVLEPNMLETIEIAVNRKTKNGVILGEDEKIDVYEALKAVTINVAYSYFEENEKGSIKEGKIADMIILSDNPLKISKDKIKDIKIYSTWKNGKEVYRNENIK